MILSTWLDSNYRLTIIAKQNTRQKMQRHRNSWHYASVVPDVRWDKIYRDLNLKASLQIFISTKYVVLKDWEALEHDRFIHLFRLRDLNISRRLIYYRHYPSKLKRPEAYCYGPNVSETAVRECRCTGLVASTLWITPPDFEHRSHPPAFIGLGNLTASPNTSDRAMAAW